MGTIDQPLRNGTPLAKAMVIHMGELMMTNGTLTGNFIQGNHSRVYVSAGERFKIVGLNTKEPVRVWSSAKMCRMNWSMVAGVTAAAAVSAAGWMGVAYLISHLLG